MERPLCFSESQHYGDDDDVGDCGGYDDQLPISCGFVVMTESVKMKKMMMMTMSVQKVGHWYLWSVWL